MEFSERSLGISTNLKETYAQKVKKRAWRRGEVQRERQRESVQIQARISVQSCQASERGTKAKRQRCQQVVLQQQSVQGSGGGEGRRGDAGDAVEAQ